MRRRLFNILAITMAAAAWGCGAGLSAQHVSPAEFYDGHPVGEAPLSATDHPGQVPSRDVQAAPPAPPLAQSGTPTPISQNTHDVIATQPSVAALTATEPSLELTTQPSLAATTAPAPPESDMSPDNYLELGLVMAEVNGHPIYANKVLQKDAIEMRKWTKLPGMTAAQFRALVSERINRTTNELINDELELAAADQMLDSKAKQIAQAMTQDYRRKLIDEAGGSLEVARQRALADGESLEDRVEDQNRDYLVRLYYQEKVTPLVNVTAADERRYYRAHLQTDFSTSDKADVFIIQVDPADTGEALAKQRIVELRRRALDGEDMANLAQYNKPNSGLRDQLTLEPHSFARAKVDDAVWKLAPGGVSDVITDDGGYYIVKLMTMHKGVVHPFEEDAVQNAIKNKLFDEQLAQLRFAELKRLHEQDTYQYSGEIVVPLATEIVMQNYAVWSKGNDK